GYCIEKSLYKSENFDTLPLYPFEDLKQLFSFQSYSLFIAVVQNPIRRRIFEESTKQGYDMPSYISSRAHTWPNLILGNNCFIGEGCVIQPFVKIGNNSIHFGSRIGHHSV